MSISIKNTFFSPKTFTCRYIIVGVPVILQWYIYIFSQQGSCWLVTCILNQSRRELQKRSFSGTGAIPWNKRTNQLKRSSVNTS